MASHALSWSLGQGLVVAANKHGGGRKMMQLVTNSMHLLKSIGHHHYYRGYGGGHIVDMYCYNMHHDNLDIFYCAVCRGNGAASGVGVVVEAIISAVDVWYMHFVVVGLYFDSLWWHR